MTTTMSGPTPRINECGHPERPHEALGKCGPCYWINYTARQEVKESRAAHSAVREAKPEVKAAKAARQATQRATPKYKAAAAAARTRYARPEVKAAVAASKATYWKTPEGKANKARSNRRRRALRAEVRHEPYSNTDIFNRDNWVCWMCKLPVSPELEWPDPGAATIGHYHAISKGGPDIPRNVGCMHWECNRKMGTNRPPIKLAPLPTGRRT